MAAAKAKNDNDRLIRVEEKLDALIKSVSDYMKDSKERLNDHELRVRSLEICAGGARMSLSLWHKVILTVASLFSIGAFILAWLR